MEIFFKGLQCMQALCLGRVGVIEKRRRIGGRYKKEERGMDELEQEWERMLPSERPDAVK